ncbi:MAG: PilZ domain-containing protein [Phycisphaerae bacterium]|jgi:hypothetical protein
MEITEICPLSEEAVAQLLAGRNAREPDTEHKARRKVARWPFPGTVELWIPDQQGRERYTLATSLNLGLGGVGIRCDEPLSPGLELALAVHEPEISFHGRGTVRHCTEMGGEYLIGLQFVFDAS